MKMKKSDLQRIRDLASEYMEMATSERQKRSIERFYATNDLKIVRPPVLIDEIPWYQLTGDGELNCITEDQGLRRLEQFFLTAKYRWKHFKCDTNFEPYYRVVTSIESSGIGISPEDKILRTDGTNNIVSHEYTDLLEDETALNKILVPSFKTCPETDKKRVEYYSEILGDAMPVRLTGRGYVYHAPWDIIARLRGVTPMLYDLYDRPEYLHKIRKRFMDITVSELDFVEKNSFVADDVYNLHCTPAQVSGREEGGWKATWLRATAQAFGDVSPEMHKEFDIDYVARIADRFKYVYYGCCEPLDNKIDVLRKIKNLRKIGVSPWANVESSAEQMGGDFVFSRKPNPAYVAISTDADVIRKETEETVKACIKYGCPCEFVLKDISTISHKPENLILWAKTVSDVLDKYYGE